MAVDGYIIATTQAGWVHIFDPMNETEMSATKAEGPIQGSPCVSRGVLYLAGEDYLAAHPLPRLEAPRWRIRLPGVPVQPLLAREHQLFAVLGQRKSRLRRLVVVEGITAGRPQEPLQLAQSHAMSGLAHGGGTSNSVYCLSAESDGPNLIRLGLSSNGSLRVESNRVSVPSGLADGTPIAAVGDNLFVVVGNQQRLCWIEGRSATFRRNLGDDVHDFGLATPSEGFVVGPDRVTLLGSSQTADLSPNERPSGASVLLREGAVAIGTKNGRVHVYDYRSPSYAQDLHVSSPSSPAAVTVLAASSEFLAAGDSAGAVVIFRQER